MSFTHSDTTQAAAQTPTAPEPATFAALDLGTNNCRLLIARPSPSIHHTKNALRVVDSFSRIVRLGEDVSSTGNLSEAAMDRTLAALRQCRSKLDRHPVTKGRYVATEACRQAKNAGEFLRRVKEETGIAIEIIDTEEEARLAFSGCASLLKKDATHAVVFDIGGGSTEFLWIRLEHGEGGDITGHQVLDWFSMPSGVMNLSEQFGGNQFVELYFEELIGRLLSKLAGFNERNAIAREIASGKVQMLSTSGTVTTLAAIHLDLPRYDRARIDGINLSIGDVRAATRKLLAMRPSERFNHPCIGSERTDFIMSGCAIFEAIARLWPTSDITIADRGVREGIILSFLQG